MKLNSVFNSIRLVMITVAMGAGCATISRASEEPELSSAIRLKNVSQVQRLLTAGADVNERDESLQQTPLMRAVQGQELSLTRLLLEHGALVNAQDDAGNTALMLAAQQGNVPLTQLLLQHGASSTQPNAQGETALSLARQKGKLAVARLLSRPVATSKVARVTPSHKGSNRAVVTLR